MNAERNCQSCDNYKDEYCNVLDMKPCYPENGCDYFEAHMSDIQEEIFNLLPALYDDIVESER